MLNMSDHIGALKGVQMIQDNMGHLPLKVLEFRNELLNQMLAAARFELGEEGHALLMRGL